MMLLEILHSSSSIWHLPSGASHKEGVLETQQHAAFSFSIDKTPISFQT